MDGPTYALRPKPATYGRSTLTGWINDTRVARGRSGTGCGRGAGASGQIPLAAWEERALVGAVAPVEHRAALAKSVPDNVAGLGPLQQNLDDPDFEGDRPA